ncbi:MAG: phosphoenolpyruvate-utilizing N-terminal domain-containing protein, partial [Planctomycetota bacterium]
MEIRKGIGVSQGYAIGPAFLVEREEFRIERRNVERFEVDGEIKRLEGAIRAAVGEIVKPLARREKKLGAVADILKAHVSLLNDKTMREEIRRTIRWRRFSAEYATCRTIRRRVKTLMSTGHDSFVQRVVQDLAELERLVLRHLLGEKREDLQHLTKPVVVVAHDLSPAQTVSL